MMIKKVPSFEIPYPNRLIGTTSSNKRLSNAHIKTSDLRMMITEAHVLELGVIDLSHVDIREDELIELLPVGHY